MPPNPTLVLPVLLLSTPPFLLRPPGFPYYPFICLKVPLKDRLTPNCRDGKSEAQRGKRFVKVHTACL